MDSQSENTAVDLLDDEAQLLSQYVYASTGQRFLNFIIDNLFMNYGLGYLTGYAVGLLIAVINPDFLRSIQARSTAYVLFIYAILLLNYTLYYFLCEKLFNGYTLGKIITGTRAIREDGEPLSAKDVILRTLCRLVPFETLSGFKTRPWHDEWSKTMVIRSR